MHSYFFPILTLFAFISQVQSDLPDPKKYSLLCLESDNDLCAGISTGDALPVYNPQSPLLIQLKSRKLAEETNTEYKKIRWDLAFGNGKIALSANNNLCAAKLADVDQSGLTRCNSSFPRNYRDNIDYGRWLLRVFKTDPNGAGVLSVNGKEALCLTAMKCNPPIDSDFCNPESDEVAWNFNTNTPEGLRRGSYLRFRPCYTSSKFETPDGFDAIQLFRARLDCSPGCTPELEDNAVCDAICNTPSCNYDSGKCITSSPTIPVPTKRPTTRSPTPPTKSPVPTITSSPTSPTPPTTPRPTLFRPTSSPTVKCPADNSLVFCKKFTNKKACQGKKSKKKCTWCLNSCLPKSSDPRVCTVPGLYSHCVTCPTTQQIASCDLTATSKKKCFKGKRKAPCTFCKKTKKCYPGLDPSPCSNPNYYANCAFPPTAPPTTRCPPISEFTTCSAFATEATCIGNCRWCANSIVPYKCQPLTLSPLQCEDPSNPIYGFFAHCGYTRSPTIASG